MEDLDTSEKEEKSAENVFSVLPPPLTVEVTTENPDISIEEYEEEKTENVEDSGAEMTGDELCYPLLSESGNELDEEDYQGPHNWRKNLRSAKSPRQQKFDRSMSLSENEKENEDMDLHIAVGDSTESNSAEPSPRLDGMEGVPRIGKENLLDDCKIREKLRHVMVMRRESMDRKTKGPLLARPTSQQWSNVHGVGSLSPQISKRRSHLAPPTESAFTRQIVNGATNTKPSSPNALRRQRQQQQPHPQSANTKIPVPATEKRVAHRQPSPRDIVPSQTAEALKKRIMKVMKARLYLLQPLGPNSFLIGGDSPNHKYRVIIGPQGCSCGRSPHCVHVLFVMLRVFQLRDNDPMLASKTLKNFEVESLFKTFHARRTSRIHDLKRKISQDASARNALPQSKQETEEKTEDEPDQNKSVAKLQAEEEEEDEEEDTCPICLLEMVEGESITECSIGCKNKLHHHCIDIWFQECRQQNEPLTCPLCRDRWHTEDNTDSTPQLGSSSIAPPEAPPNTRASSPAPPPPTAVSACSSSSVPAPPVPPPEADVMLPRAEPISSEYRDAANPWIPVLGEDLVSCLFSKNWQLREVGLRTLGRVASGALLLGMGVGRAGVIVSSTRQATTLTMLECCCSVLAIMCGDPVYKVFVAGLKTLRSVLSFTPCRDEGQQARLQALVKPVIQTILWKCADSNKRTSQLSLSSLQELIKGQDGELSVGKEIAQPGVLGLGGVAYITHCITDTYDPDTVQWQWLLGRFYMLDKILEDFPQEFVIYPNKEPNTNASLKNYNKVMNILYFTKPALGHSHVKVGKSARRVFYLIARMQTHNQTVFNEISDLLNDLDTNLQVNMKRRLLRLAEEFHIAQKVREVVSKEDYDIDEEHLPLFNTPTMSATSTPRCTSPVSVFNAQASTQDRGTHITVTVNNFVRDNHLYPPLAPPNSPERGNRGKSLCTHSTQTEGEAGLSDMEIQNRTVSDVASGLLTPPTTPQHHGAVGDAKDGTCQQQQQRQSVEMADASVETSPQLQMRGLRRMRPVMHFKGPHPHPKVQLRLSGSPVKEPAVNPLAVPISEQEALPFSFMEDPAYDASHDEEAPLNNTVVSQDEPEHEDASTSTHEAVSSDENGEGYVVDHGDIVVEMSHENSVSRVSDLSLNHSQEGLVSEDEDGALSSIHGSQDNLAHEVNSQDSLVDEGDDDCSISSLHATATSTAGNLTDDFSELLSPSVAAEDKVSFKTEVASSPHHSSQEGSPAGGSSQEHCACKEEVEKEEAKALVAAMEKSQLEQSVLPYVPGLTQDQGPDHTMTIHVQNEDTHDGDNSADASPHRYLEDADWRRGPMIGTGAFSTCYQAKDTRTGTLMCVKQISFCRNSLEEQERVVEAVQEEIEMMSKLNHPNIVRILGATQQGCHFFMFVEWMPGGAVSNLLACYGRFAESVIVSYTQQILHGLSYLHENHVLHRDLKGANLLVDSTGQRVRIGDFGASARLASRQTAAGEFQGQLLGTIAFMAPEVLRGENYGRSCDVWSVGCTVIEMVTTKPPWGANDISNHLALIFKIASTIEPPPIPDAISPPLRDLLLRCLEVKRDERPAAKELLKHPLFTMGPKR